LSRAGEQCLDCKVTTDLVQRGSYYFCHNHACEHGRHPSSCLECIPLDKLLKKKWVCFVCASRRTRSGMCRECFYEKAGTTEVRYEAIIASVLESFFGAAAITNRRVMIAGMACTAQVNGDNCEGGKTKGKIFIHSFLIM
jgi:hypothetical protein